MYSSDLSAFAIDILHTISQRSKQFLSGSPKLTIVKTGNLLNGYVFKFTYSQKTQKNKLLHLF